MNNMLEDLSTSLEKGSVFKADYQPYLDYPIFGIKGSNEKESLLLKIYEVSFYLNDLNLYLDVHDNPDILKEFNKYTNIYNSLVSDYEALYGPINLTTSYDNEFKWLNNWPWEVTNV